MAYSLPEDYLAKGRTCLNQAEDCLKLIDYPTCIERAAECIELSLKAAITMVGKQYSHDHVVAGDLENARDAFPHWLREKAPRLALISKLTSFLYLYAKYGYEAMQAPPKTLFSRHDANSCIEAAREVLLDCERFFYETRPK